MTFQDLDTDDIHSLALVAWKEARGEGIVGMLAVMHVCINRIGKPGFASTLHDVIYGKNQFTSMSVPSDPEFDLQPSINDKMFDTCMTMAEAIDSKQDITNNALYYANLKYVTSGWFFDNIINDSTKHPITTKIGNHTFFA